MTGPSLARMRSAAEKISGECIRTPVLPLSSDRWYGILPQDAQVRVKLELFQQAGSFKARGVYLGLAELTDEQRKAGVVAASGGNHALAVAWGARKAGIPALITMPSSVDQVRKDGCREMGAEVVLCEGMAAAFKRMEAEAAGGRTMMHPFDGEHMTLGAATCGLEFIEQADDLEVVVVPVGGGGLIGGMAAAVKAVKPEVRVIGVEPEGADSLTRSFVAGRPAILDRTDTIADSLSAPKALDYSFSVARSFVDEMIHITDDAMRQAMLWYFDVLRLIAEPACAASLAAIAGPLKERLAGKRVGIIACGSNISLARFGALTGRDV